MKGKIYIVGLGAGKKDFMTFQAEKALFDSDIIIGYTVYIDMLKNIFPNLNYISSPMKKETERCRLVLEKALEGKTVSIVSSGDSGIYGMAGIMLQIAEGYDVEIETVCGVTAISSCASVLGAPVTHDFAVISLSDLMTPLELIYKRIECAGMGDFVIGIYNPKSKSRKDYLEKSAEIIMKYRSPDTPVGIVRHCGRDEQSHTLTTLENLKNEYVDMFCTVIIGNSNTYIKNGKMITPRGYNIEKI